MAQPASTSKIFIGRLPHTMTEEKLRETLSQHGQVVSLFYMADQLQQQAGWAFATYSSPEEAQLAVSAIDGILTFEGFEAPAECRFANQKPQSAKEKKDKEGVKADPNAAPGSGSPWQQFFTASGHAYYYNSVTGVTQWERPADADKPMPSPAQAAAAAAAAARSAGGGRLDSQFGPPGANLFVFHLPNDWNDVDLIQHFQHFGDILSARIQKDTEGRNRGFGFVSFADQTAAVHAIRGMHGFCVGGKFLKVQLKKGEELRLTPALRAMLPASHQPGGAYYGGGPGVVSVASGTQGASSQSRGFGPY